MKGTRFHPYSMILTWHKSAAAVSLLIRLGEDYKSERNTKFFFFHIVNVVNFIIAGQKLTGIVELQPTSRVITDLLFFGLKVCIILNINF